LPDGVSSSSRPIPCKWARRVNKDAQRNIERYKAKWCYNVLADDISFNQQPGFGFLISVFDARKHLFGIGYYQVHGG
jgi:hypothetical protein